METSADGAWRLLALADGFLTTQLLSVAAELRLADALAAGPRTAPEVAATVGGDPDVIARILRGLCVNENDLDHVFVEHPDGRFALGPLGEYLRDGVPNSQRGPVRVRGALYFAAAQGLLNAATGADPTSPFEQQYGQAFFTHLDASPEHAAVFQASMAGRAAHEAEAVVQHYELKGRLVDVGAGPGTLTQVALRTFPDLVATLVDRPMMIDRARQTIDAAGLTDRCTFVEADFFESVPAGGDVYLLSRVLHDWADDDAIRILRTCRVAMTPEARLLVVDAVLPAMARDKPAAIRMDLLMLLLFRARERTEAEFRELLARAGFEVLRVIPTASPTGLAIIEARCNFFTPNGERC